MRRSHGLWPSIATIVRHNEALAVDWLLLKASCVGLLFCPLLRRTWVIVGATA
jgi:hypothetical protein